MAQANSLVVARYDYWEKRELGSHLSQISQGLDSIPRLVSLALLAADVAPLRQRATFPPHNCYSLAAVFALDASFLGCHSCLPLKRRLFTHVTQVYQNTGVTG